jgi:hypothetical protein
MGLQPQGSTEVPGIGAREVQLASADRAGIHKDPDHGSDGSGVTSGGAGSFD